MKTHITDCWFAIAKNTNALIIGEVKSGNKYFIAKENEELRAETKESLIELIESKGYTYTDSTISN